MKQPLFCVGGTPISFDERAEWTAQSPLRNDGSPNCELTEAILRSLFAEESSGPLCLSGMADSFLVDPRFLLVRMRQLVVAGIVDEIPGKESGFQISRDIFNRDRVERVRNRLAQLRPRQEVQSTPQRRAA